MFGGTLNLAQLNSVLYYECHVFDALAVDMFDTLAVDIWLVACMLQVVH